MFVTAPITLTTHRAAGTVIKRNEILNLICWTVRALKNPFLFHNHPPVPWLMEFRSTSCVQDGITTDRDKSGFVNSLAPLPRHQVKSLSKGTTLAKEWLCWTNEDYSANHTGGIISTLISAESEEGGGGEGDTIQFFRHSINPINRFQLEIRGEWKFSPNGTDFGVGGGFGGGKSRVSLSPFNLHSFPSLAEHPSGFNLYRDFAGF